MHGDLFSSFSFNCQVILAQVILERTTFVVKKVILSADSACDIGPILQERYDVKLFQFHILIGDKSYQDGIDIQPEDIYKLWREEGVLPKTAAITPAEYLDHFSRWTKQGYEVVHLNLGTGLTSSHQNAQVAAHKLGNVYPIDAASLSSGFGLLVVKAGELIQAGCSGVEVKRMIDAMHEKTHASFVLDTLEFMKAGGRCSAVTAFGANLLKLKVGIRVDNTKGGSMGVGKKYRGAMEKVLVEYVRDELKGREDLDLDRVFITHSGSPDSDIELAKKEVGKLANFKELFVTRASCSISSHCGPRTLGVLYMTK